MKDHDGDYLLWVRIQLCKPDTIYISENIFSCFLIVDSSYENQVVKSINVSL